MKAAWAQGLAILRNDLLLLRRSLGYAAVLRLGFFLAALALGHFLVIAICAFFHGRPSLALESGIWWLFAFMMVGSAMNAAIGSLYERSDFDLLLSSPAPSRVILLARLSSITAAGLFSVAIFMPSLIDPAVFFYGPRYLACYPAWVFLAITAGAAGSALTLLLVRLLGVRRAQTLSQVVATLLGASVFLACQLPAIFLHNSTDRDRLLKLFGRLLEFPVVTLPARAGRADIGALVLTVLIASAAVVLTSALFSRTFITGLQNLSAIPSAGPRLRRHRWSEGLWTATFRKDLRLIARDPVLFARTLPQCIFILPLGIALGRWMGWRVVAPCGFIVGIQLSSALCSITIGGEECWDLIRMSPSSELRLRSAKIAAAMAVPMLIVLTISAALAAFGSLRLALLTFGISLACSAGCSWISFSSPILGPRGGLTRHRGFGAGQGNGDVSTQILLCLFFFFTGTGGLACAASGRYSLLSATLLSLALAGSAGCFAFVRLKAVVWTEDQPTP